MQLASTLLNWRLPFSAYCFQAIKPKQLTAVFFITQQASSPFSASSILTASNTQSLLPFSSAVAASVHHHIASFISVTATPFSVNAGISSCHCRRRSLPWSPSAAARHALCFLYQPVFHRQQPATNVVPSSVLLPVRLFALTFLSRSQPWLQSSPIRLSSSSKIWCCLRRSCCLPSLCLSRSSLPVPSKPRPDAVVTGCLHFHLGFSSSSSRDLNSTLCLCSSSSSSPATVSSAPLLPPLSSTTVRSFQSRSLLRLWHPARHLPSLPALTSSLSSRCLQPPRQLPSTVSLHARSALHSACMFTA